MLSSGAGGQRGVRGVGDGVSDELDELVELDELDELELDELDVLELDELDVLVSDPLVVEIPVVEVLAVDEVAYVSEEGLLVLVTLSTIWRLPDEVTVVSAPDVFKVLVLDALEVSVDVRLGRSVELDDRSAEVVEEELDWVVIPGASELVTDVDEEVANLEETVSRELECSVGERSDCDELVNAELKLAASCDDTAD
ncbi:hypothetical protein LA080_014526 [Diaporthe eres]|nr:hypothetical protein LA080_014526 [Diaporthe eres]